MLFELSVDLTKVKRGIPQKCSIEHNITYSLSCWYTCIQAFFKFRLLLTDKVNSYIYIYIYMQSRLWIYIYIYIEYNPILKLRKLQKFLDAFLEALYGTRIKEEYDIRINICWIHPPVSAFSQNIYVWNQDTGLLEKHKYASYSHLYWDLRAPKTLDPANCHWSSRAVFSQARVCLPKKNNKIKDGKNYSRSLI